MEAISMNVMVKKMNLIFDFIMKSFFVWLCG